MQGVYFSFDDKVGNYVNPCKTAREIVNNSQTSSTCGLPYDSYTLNIGNSVVDVPLRVSSAGHMKNKTKPIRKIRK